MQFVPPLFFSRPGKGEGGRRRCFSRVYGRGGLAVCRQGELGKKCAIAVKKIGKEFVGILKSITFAPQSPQ